MDPRVTFNDILMRQEWSVERQNTTDRVIFLPSQSVLHGGLGSLNKGHGVESESVIRIKNGVDVWL